MASPTLRTPQAFCTIPSDENTQTRTKRVVFIAAFSASVRPIAAQRSRPTFRVENAQVRWHFECRLIVAVAAERGPLFCE